METIIHYIPYVLLFALATAIIYAWGLWRTMKQQQDLSNILSAKGVAIIKKTLRKNVPMNRNTLQSMVNELTVNLPFSREQIAVTDPKQFLDSVLPYMVKQRIITEEKENGRTVYRLNK